MTAGISDHELHARRLGKDGLLFLALAAIAGLMVVGLLLILSQDVPELTMGVGVGGASALVFVGMGLLKLVQARRTGLQLKALAIVGVLAALYPTSIVVVVCGWILPSILERAVGHYAPLVSWAVPVLACLVPLTFRLCNPISTPLQRSAYATAASYLCWSFIIASVASENWRWILFGAQVAQTNVLALWSRDLFWLIPSLLLAGVSGIIYLSITAFALRAEVRANGLTAAAVRVRRWARFSAGILLMLCIALSTKRVATYWSVISALLLLSGALLCGSLFSRVRQAGVVSFRRRALFTTPLLLLSFPLITAAGIAGSAWHGARYDGPFNFNYHPDADWVWSLPDCIRVPLANLVGKCSPDLMWGMRVNGLVSVAELESEALRSPAKPVHPYQQESIWQALSLRAPQGTLARVRAIEPLPPGSKLLNTTYDFGAGIALGILGSDDEIRAHLARGYSVQFVDGMLEGMRPERRRRFSRDIVAYFELLRYDPASLYWFSEAMPNEYFTLANTAIDTPTPANRWFLIHLFTRGLTPLNLFRRALNSPNPAVQRLAIQALLNRSNYAVDNEIMQQLIAIMKGEAEKQIDPDAQRDAAELISKRLRIGGFWVVSYGVPLSQPEQDQITICIKKAQEWLTVPLSRR